MILMDDHRVRTELRTANVSIVMCGHEHQTPPAPQAAIVEDGALLVLQAGSPTLRMNHGNHDDPQLSFYEIVHEGSTIELDWLVGRLDPTRWVRFGRYRHDGSRWHWLGTGGPLPPALQLRPKPPFRSGP